MRRIFSAALLVSTALMVFVVPSVRAQTSSITALQTPSVASVGQPVTVTVSATYNLGSDGHAVSIGIFDLDAWWATGSASSAGDTCLSVSHPAAFCGYIPTSQSGSDVVTFQLVFNSTKTYRLRALVEIYDANAQLVSGASASQDFSIAVSQSSGPTQSNVISGESTGLAPDATISSVSFSLEGDNLVTILQVGGSISNTYSYTIDIKANSTSNLPDYIISYNYNPLGSGPTGPHLYAATTSTNTPITNSTVVGNRWTATVPLSWINGLTDFWAGATTLQSESWGMQLIDEAAGSPGHLQWTEIKLGRPYATASPTISPFQYNTITQTPSTAVCEKVVQLPNGTYSGCGVNYAGAVELAGTIMPSCNEAGANKQYCSGAGYAIMQTQEGNAEGLVTVYVTLGNVPPGMTGYVTVLGYWSYPAFVNCAGPLGLCNNPPSTFNVVAIVNPQ